MKKIPIILMSLLLSASVLTSCAKPIIDSAIDASETIVDTSNGNSGGSENNGGENNNGTEDNNGENNNGEVAPPNLDEPDGASVYSGTPDTSWYDEFDVQSEYILTTADQLMGLNQLRKDSDGAINFDGVTIKLGADMVFNRGTMEEILTSDDNEPWVTVASSHSFLGVLDGQGHTISGAYLKLGSSAVQGMFGSLAKNAEIKDLKVINTVVTGPTAKDKNTLGTLVSKVVGDDANVTISNVTVHSTVKEAGYKTTWVGGIIGAITDAGTLNVKNSYFYGSVTTSGRSAGGILGAALNTKATVNITDCENHGDISANCDAGGLIGTSAVALLNADGSKNSGTVNAPTCQGDLFGYQSYAVDSKNGLRPEGTDFRVMSFNVQADFDSFSDAGKERLFALRQEILFYDPDFICFQEDSKDFLNKVRVSDDGKNGNKADLSAYKMISQSTLNGSGNCSIFYKSGITLKKSGTKYLTSDGTSNTVGLTAKDVTTEGSKYQLTSAELAELGINSSTNMKGLKTSEGGGMLTTKFVNYGVFELNGKTIIVISAHLQHRSQNAAYSTPAVQKIRLMERLKELSYVQSCINSLKNTYSNAEVVIAGDFNDLVGSDTYLELKKEYGYSSAHETAVARYGVSATWNNAFKLNVQGSNYPSAADRSSNSMLDFCFISSGLKALKFRVGAGSAPFKYQTFRYTSDHLPIITDITFNTSEPTVNPPSVYTGEADTSWYVEGTKSYTLTTADQFMGINKLREESKGAITFDGVTIKLGADIIINEGTLANIKANGADNETIVVTGSDAPFKGTFDGQGHSISGVYLSTEYSYRSIFGTVGGSAQIKNFVLENSYFSISNKPYFGAIVGRINDASANVSLTNITLADTVLLEEGSSGIKNVGGFVGALNAGKLTVNNCHFNGTVNFPNGEHIAGFVGQASGGTTIVFNNCHGTGKVVAKDYVTGLSVYTDTTTKSNNGSCLTGSISCTTGSNQNASYIK